VTLIASGRRVAPPSLLFCAEERAPGAEFCESIPKSMASTTLRVEVASLIGCRALKNKSRVVLSVSALVTGLMYYL
jgi:hypothetical protein